MLDIAEIHVHYVTHAGEKAVIIQEPSAKETVAIKHDVAEIVRDLRKRGDVKYWYMVLKVNRTDGSFGYRTMIPKTFL